MIIALAVAGSAAAAGTIPFRVIAHGISTLKTTPKPFALVASSRADARRIILDVPPAAAQAVLRTSFRRSIVVGVFGPFGCKDDRVGVARVTQAGTVLTVHLTVKPLAPGTVECQAVYETARVLVVPRAALHGVPAKAMVTVAGS